MTARQIVSYNSEVIEDNMGEVWAARAIPHSPDAGGRCLKAFIHLHVTTAGCFNSGQFQANPLGVGCAATGDQNMGAFQIDLRPVPDRVEFYPLTGFSFDPRNASTRDNFNSFLAAHIV